MLVLEYKIKAKLVQYKAIDEAIRTVQFIRNKAIRYWMDAPKDAKINRFALNKYSTELRNEFKFVKDLNSMATKSREGHSRSNALGVEASTLVGAILLGQASMLIKESPRMRDRRVSILLNFPSRRTGMCALTKKKAMLLIKNAD